MTFICEDIGTTKRKAMSPSRALAIWEANGGICWFCKLRIDGTREDWYVEHKRALELGGKDEDANCAPAHYWHKAGKDADDHSRTAKAKRSKRNHLGIKSPNRRKLPGGKDSAIKIKIDGTRVWRATGLPVGGRE